MLVIVDRSALLAILPPLAKLCARRSPRPQLACVHIVAEKRKLRLTATDGQCWVQRECVDVDVQKPGAALISAADLTAATDAATGATVKMEVEVDRLTIRGDREVFRLPGYPPADFPPVPKVVVGDKIGAAILARAIHAVSHAIATSASRYATSGIGFMSSGASLDVVATDGCRMAIFTLPHKGEHGAILPDAASRLLGSMLDGCEAEEMVAFGTNKEMVYAAGEGWKFWSNVIEGTFPPYKEVVPRGDPTTRVTLDRAELNGAVRGAALSAGTDDPVVQFIVTPAEKAVLVGARTPERGESRVHLIPSDVDGKPMAIGFRPRYLLDALAPCQNPVVELCISKQNGPTVIREVEYVAIVMPRNIDHPLEDEPSEAMATT